MLNRLLTNPHFKAFSVPNGCNPITHLAYADDFLIFAVADKKMLTSLMKIIRLFENTSEQVVNSAKSCFLVPQKGSTQLSQRIKVHTGYSKKNFPINYLGCPLYIGKKMKALFSDLFSKISNKIWGWSNKFLSTGGRIVLLKSVLMAFPIHLFVVLQPPKWVLLDLEIFFANFLWGMTEHGK